MRLLLFHPRHRKISSLLFRLPSKGGESGAGLVLGAPTVGDDGSLFLVPMPTLLLRRLKRYLGLHIKEN